MAVQIPWFRSADTQFELALDGFVYMIRLRWLERAGAWAMDIHTREKTPVVLGMRITAGAELVDAREAPFAPPGRFYLLGDPPTFESMIDGSTRLIYITAAEIDAL